jgi:hypothetical protein
VKDDPIRKDGALARDNDRGACRDSTPITIPTGFEKRVLPPGVPTDHPRGVINIMNNNGLLCTSRHENFHRVITIPIRTGVERALDAPS